MVMPKKYTSKIHCLQCLWINIYILYVSACHYSAIHLRQTRRHKTNAVTLIPKPISLCRHRSFASSSIRTLGAMQMWNNLTHVNTYIYKNVCLVEITQPYSFFSSDSGFHQLCFAFVA